MLSYIRVVFVSIHKNQSVQVHDIILEMQETLKTNIYDVTYVFTNDTFLHFDARNHSFKKSYTCFFEHYKKL